MDQTVVGGVVLVTSETVAAFLVGDPVEHSSNSMLPFFRSRAEPPKKE
jgi:hypothetical protein